MVDGELAIVRLMKDVCATTKYAGVLLGGEKSFWQAVKCDLRYCRQQRERIDSPRESNSIWSSSEKVDLVSTSTSVRHMILGCYTSRSRASQWRASQLPPCTTITFNCIK